MLVCIVTLEFKLAGYLHLLVVIWRILTTRIDYYTSQSASSLYKKRARSRNLPINVSNYVRTFPTSNGYSVQVECITVFRLTWKALSCSWRPNVLIHVKARVIAKSDLMAVWPYAFCNNPEATYTAFHYVRLHYFRTKWILWCKNGISIENTIYI